MTSGRLLAGRALLLAQLGALATLAACGESKPPAPECLADVDCPAAELCIEQMCRSACDGTEACPLGLLCVTVAGGMGVCQLETDTRCALSSDCPLPLVCRGGSCLNECMEDVDCPFAGICAPDGEGGNVCMATGGCVIDGECPRMFVCYFGGCVPECRADRDCPSDSACIEMRCLRR